MATLDKPQIQPTIPIAPSTKDWKTMAAAVVSLYRLLSSLILYLQTYLTKVYNAVTPFQLNVVTISQDLSPYSVETTNEFIAASASPSAACVIYLPPAAGPNVSGNGRVIVIKKMDPNAQNIAVTPDPGTFDTIDGVNLAVNITIQWDVLRVIELAPGAWGTW